MARRTAQTATGNTPFTGTQYAALLETRRIAMAGFAEGTVDTATKNAARAAVRNARKAVDATGMSMSEWREAEQAREDALKASRSRARQAKKEQAAA